MKKFATLVGSAALLAASLVPAIAATNNCTNGTTGPFSNNTCAITNTDRISVNNVNDAYIKNDVNVKSSTGYNSASLNTLGGSIVTGDATSNVTISNIANVNTTNISSDLAGGARNVGGNSITGPVSDNFAFITNTFDAEISNSNTLKIKNDVDVDAKTGGNDANTNTGPASILTGNAWVGLSLMNHGNDNLNNISGGAGGFGSNTAENSTTGPFSNNTVAITNTRRAYVNNVNDMYVKNDVDVEANTGENDTNKNTLGGFIDTGNAHAGVGVNTEGNINTTLIAMGGFTDNYGANNVTGPGGVGDPNEVYITNTRDVAVENWNNKCESHNADDQFGDWYWNRELKQFVRKDCDVKDLGVFNYVDVDTKTGGNDADTNTGGGDVQSGLAELWQQVLTHFNDTYTQIH